MIATTTDNGNINMAAQTGNTYIYGTIIDSVEIPTAILGFSTITSYHCDNDRQPEIAIWPPKQEGVIFLEL